jgi:transposase
VELNHERDDIREYYSKFQGEVIVGIEACGYTNWFEELMEQLGHTLLGGDAAEIRRLARRRQKNDRRDAALLLDLLVHNEFPASSVIPGRVGKYCGSCGSWRTGFPVSRPLHLSRRHQ